MLRSLALVTLTLTLAACGGGESADGDGIDWQFDAEATGAEADTTGAAALFAHFADGTVDDAFERLAAQPYAVTVTLVDLDPDTARESRSLADTLGLFRQRIEFRPGAPLRVLATEARGTLADSSGLDPARLAPANPLPGLIPGEAPFLDPSTRGAYRLDVMPMNIGRQLTLRVADPAAERPLVRTANVADLMMNRLILSVSRESRSAIYDETSSTSVTLRDHPDRRVPTEVTTSTRTATPGRRRWLRTRWDIVPESFRSPAQASAQDSTMNSREP